MLKVCLELQNAVMFSHLRGFWECSLQQREQYHCHSWLPKNPQPLRHRMSVRGIIDILAWPEDTSLMMSVCSPDPAVLCLQSVKTSCHHVCCFVSSCCCPCSGPTANKARKSIVCTLTAFSSSMLLFILMVCVEGSLVVLPVFTLKGVT